MKKQLHVLSVIFSFFFYGIVSETYAQSKTGKPEVTLSRKVSTAQYAPDGNPVVVITVTINKNAYKGHARLEESFSSDMQATVIAGNHATFNSNNGKATFEWNDIPDDRQVAVSYALKATKPMEEGAVSGQFFYHNQTFNTINSSFSLKASGFAKIYQEPVSKSTNTLEDLHYIVFGTYPGGSDASAPTYTYKAASPKATMPVSTNASSMQKPAEAPKPAVVPPAPAPAAAPTEQKPVVAETPKTPEAPATPGVNSNASSFVRTSYVTIPGNSESSNHATGDLIYRIQIAAIADKSKVEGVLKQYHLSDEEPYLEVVNNNIIRVMVDSYSNLGAAKTRIEELKGKGVTGAFVAPYYKGKRITVQEAATHTAQ
jgi:hypothetical protein